MDKEFTLSEIRRTAKANGGSPLGWRRFEDETGIKYYDWCGKHWSRWSDAVREAGLEPNRLSQAYDDEILLEKIARLTRELNHAPTDGELRLATRKDAASPSHNVFRRLGNKAQRVARMIAFCEGHPEFEDIVEIWRAVEVSEAPPDDHPSGHAPTVGYVYLLRHGTRREYKIGRTNNPTRREGQLAIQLPEKLTPVHYIQTDDPAGVETYWHKRFAAKRKEGEWFALTPDDVQAFKRWKKIY